MKKNVLLFFTLLFYIEAYTQDLLVMKNGDEIQVKVLEVQPDVIKYKKWDNLDGPSYSENKTAIFMIKYQNGSKDVFKQESQVVNSAVPSNDENKKNKAFEILNNAYIKFFGSDNFATYKLISLKKTNGIMRNIAGQMIYEIYFDMTIQTQRDGYKVGNGAEGYWGNFNLPAQKPDLYASGQQFLYDTKFIAAGTTFIFSGTATLIDSDNGFILQDKKIKTVKDLGVTSMQGANTQIESKPSVTYPATPIDLTSFIGGVISNDKKYIIKIADINIINSATNSNYVKSKIVNYLKNIYILNQEKKDIVDTLKLISKISFSTRNYSTNVKLNFFTDCIAELSLLNVKTNKIEYINAYKFSNYSLLAVSYLSAQESENSFINNELIEKIWQFIQGNFPITGNIVEVLEKNNKNDEAKLVKINIGKDQGIVSGYELFMPELGAERNNDLVVKESFKDYSVCKVKRNGKKIVAASNQGKNLKVKTIYVADGN